MLEKKSENCHLSSVIVIKKKHNVIMSQSHMSQSSKAQNLDAAIRQCGKGKSDEREERIW